MINPCSLTSHWYELLHCAKTRRGECFLIIYGPHHIQFWKWVNMHSVCKTKTAATDGVRMWNHKSARHYWTNTIRHMVLGTSQLCGSEQYRRFTNRYCISHVGPRQLRLLANFSNIKLLVMLIINFNHTLTREKYATVQSCRKPKLPDPTCKQRSYIVVVLCLHCSTSTRHCDEVKYRRR